jgi:hypothetical protein
MRFMEGGHLDCDQRATPFPDPDPFPIAPTHPPTGTLYPTASPIPCICRRHAVLVGLRAPVRGHPPADVGVTL